MSAGLDELDYWRAHPLSFIESVLIDPETDAPFELLPAERQFFTHAFQLNPDGRLRYSEFYSCPKKSGKTTAAGLFVLTLLLLFGGAYPEATICANDQEQSVGRVFTMIRRIIECSPLLKRAARILTDRILFPAFNATITAIPSNAASAAGGAQCIATFDELWAFTGERSRRLYDELVPVLTRKISCRLVTTYAGFVGESVLLEELYARGMALPEVAPDLRAGDGMLFFWSHRTIAPWQTPRWIEEMRRSLRPSAYLRLIENQFVSNESSFVDMSAWDACVQPELTPVLEDRILGVFIGVDASTKRDSTALVAVSHDRGSGCVRLVTHKVFTPTAGDPIDFALIEQTLLQWHQRYRVREIRFDPYQMQATSQKLTRAHLPIVEFPQTVPNLTASTSNLFDLIQSRQLALYADAPMRLAASRAVIVESARGWRLDKLKQSHKIDVVVALSMACLAAIEGAAGPQYDSSGMWLEGFAQLALGPGHYGLRPQPRAAEDVAAQEKADAEWRAQEYWMGRNVLYTGDRR